jgi:putative transposase
VVIAGANVPDFKLLEATLDAIVVERYRTHRGGSSTSVSGQGLRQRARSGGGGAPGDYQAHIRRIGEEKKDLEGNKHYPARRWVVERTLGWLSKCRSILVLRYEKKAANYLGLIKVACILLWYRRQHRLSF